MTGAADLFRSFVQKDSNAELLNLLNEDSRTSIIDLSRHQSVVVFDDVRL